MTSKQRLEKIIDIFETENPFPETELNYKTEYELIVAVILSAQCTDVRVNKITPELFSVFPDAVAMANASVDAIFKKIKSCSYPNNKAKNLHNMSQMLVDKYGGKLPQDAEDMQQLPGVGRKTANVLSSVLFKKNVLAVDTHVLRVAHRIGIVPSTARTPILVEKAITKIAPKNSLFKLHHWLILHGRYTCIARKPRCQVCSILPFCNYKQKVLS